MKELKNRSIFYLTCFVYLLILFSHSIFTLQHLKLEYNSMKRFKIIDALGIQNKNVFYHSKFPYDVKKCDDMIEFEAEYIVDLTDYRIKKSAFFNLNIYRISMFESKNPKHLIHSILLSSMTVVPQPLLGAKNCISVDSGHFTAEMTICLKSEKDMKNIIDQISKFDRCRAGDNLIQMPPETKKKLEKLCKEQNDQEVGVKDPSKKKANIPVRPGNKWDILRDSFLYPKEYTVPGASDFELK